MRTLFKEGFGIIGGAVGTLAGTSVAIFGAAGIGAMFGLCLGPFGMFVLVFLFASAGGVYFSHKFKDLGSEIYDIGAHVENGRFFYSPDQIIGTF
jgi:hypothetical protein